MYGSGPAGLLPIRMQSVVSRTPITLADAFCRIGVEAKPRWIGDEPLPLIDGVLVWFDHGAETRLFETDGAAAIRCKLRDQAAPVRKDRAVPRRPGHRRNGAGAGRGN